MPKCKKSFCQEEAIPFGKRYCPEHMQEYKQKQREYEEISTTLRCCDQCGDKLTKTRHDLGETLCRACADQLNLHQDIVNKRETKIQSLNACSTISDLKDFIREYLIQL